MATAPQEPVFTLLTSPAELGSAVRRSRLALGLSIREAAGRCGVSKRFIVSIESGKPTVRLDKALQVMSALNLLAIIVPLEEAMAALVPGR